MMKFKRTIEWTKANLFKGDELKRQRSDFVKFINEKDKRRGTDFLGTFPELRGFYNECKNNTSN